MSAQVKSFCVHHDGYSVVTFPKELCRAHLADIRDAGERVVAELANLKSPQCIVDLTNMEYLGSSMVAAIVRIWKAIDSNQGRMVVAASSNGVREVLGVTGLNKIWSISSSYDSALHDLGYSVQAKIVKRELRLLAFVGPATLLVGVVATALSRVPKLASLTKPHEYVALSLIGMAAVTSGISVFRERSWRRWLSVVVFLCSIVLLGYMFWTAPPVGTEEKSKTKTSTTTGVGDIGGKDIDKGESKSTDMQEDNPSDSEASELASQLGKQPLTPPGATGEVGPQRARTSVGDTAKPKVPEENGGQANSADSPATSEVPDESDSDSPASTSAESGDAASERSKPVVEKP